MKPRHAGNRPRVSIDTYRDDRLYPRVVQAVEKLLAKGNVVTPVDVLINVGLLDPKRLEDWRFGRAPCLERVVITNLQQLSLILRILRYYAHDMGLKPSRTAYMRWGKGRKRRLRFTKTGHAPLEEAYSTHFVRGAKKTTDKTRMTSAVITDANP